MGMGMGMVMGMDIINLSCDSFRSMKKFEKIILVTGSHRSGSTWLGKMLSLDDDTGYIHEPFNIVHVNSPFKEWFFHVHNDLPKGRINEIRSFLDRYMYLSTTRLFSDISQANSIKSAVKLLRDFYRVGRNQWTCSNLIVKDPIAILSAEWLASSYNMSVVMLVRHPAAFVGSLKIGDTQHDFNHFLRQPVLMERYLQPFQEEIQFFAKNPQPVIDQAILLWNIIHQCIYEYHIKHPDFILVRHEDMSIDPLKTFEVLYNKLGLQFSKQVKEKLLSYTSTNDEKIGIKRDSVANIKSWKGRLTEVEVKRIYDATQPFSAKFYNNEDW